MRERLYRFAAILFLLLAAGAVVICFRSYRTVDWIYWAHFGSHGHYGRIGGGTYAGVIGVHFTRSYNPTAYYSPGFKFEYRPQQMGPTMFYPISTNTFDRFGFGFTLTSNHSTGGGPYYQFIQVTAPAWFVATALLLIGLWLRGCANRLRRIRLHGLCQVCGYDLRATPEAGGPLLDRCPECGHVASPRHVKTKRAELIA